MQNLINLPNSTNSENQFTNQITDNYKAKLTKIATQNIKDILKYSLKFDSKIHKALIIFDTQNELPQILTNSYRENLSNATFIDFDKTKSSEIIASFQKLKAEDLVILIQSSNFRLDEFRIRIHLFNLKLKVIEHLHLHRNEPESWESYVSSLSYNPDYYNKMGSFLKTKISNCQNLTLKYTTKISKTGKIKSEEENSKNPKKQQIQEKTYELITGELEIPKLNTGNYENMVNVGGTFPIGEVFCEARNLESMNGSFWVWAFADSNFELIFADPFCVNVENGLVVSWSNAPKEFVEIIEKVKQIERPVIREIGFGLNTAIDKKNPLGDITAFERIVGIHLSLGEKHSVYKKPGITVHKSRFHVDLFVLVDQVLMGDTVIFENGKYLV